MEYVKSGGGQHNYSEEDKKEQKCDADFTTATFQRIWAAATNSKLLGADAVHGFTRQMLTTFLNI
ncbi:hypothetical protein SESBI_51232 [Sesbania bispinosa]|nr:hypothetical protein SESBI_51232 [Sesbania bispinosa]